MALDVALDVAKLMVMPASCDTSGIREGDGISIERENGMMVHNVTSGERIAIEAQVKIMLEILDAGGPVPNFRQLGDFSPIFLYDKYPS